MDNIDIQEVIHQAVKIATRAAMNGNPVSSITWLAPQTASQDPLGSFIVARMGPQSASILPWYEDK